MLKNTPQAYGLVSIALHWGSAIGILFLFGLGLYMVELSYYDAWYRDALTLHKSIGITVFAVWMLRLLWRAISVMPTREVSSQKQRFEQRAAHIVHGLLYVIVVALLLSGYLISTADGRGIEVFGLFEVPALPELIEQQEDRTGYLHWLLAWGLIALVSVHALAALKHHFVDKDDTLLRMIRSR